MATTTTTNMTGITLAKALKLKNRLAGRLSKVQEDIRQYNSVLQEQKGKVDVAALTKTRDEIMEGLIALKTTIIRANGPIQNLIIRQGELRSKIEFLNMIPTRDGTERHGYQNTEVVFVATLKKPDIDNEVRSLEKEIDTIQDQIDEFNHSHKIEVAQKTLDLAS